MHARVGILDDVCMRKWNVNFTLIDTFAFN